MPKSGKDRTTSSRDPRHGVRYRRLAFFQKVSLVPILLLCAYGLLSGLVVSSLISFLAASFWFASWYLLRVKQFVQAACWTYLAGTAIFFSLNAALGGQMRSDMFWLLPMVPMTACFVLNERAIKYCVGGCAVLICAVLAVEQLGLLSDLEPAHGWPETLALRLSGLFIFTQFGLSASRISDSQILKLNQEQEKLQASKQAAERAKISKSNFLATMSHEIRTPMNGILGMTQHLLNRPRPAAQREAIEMIRQSSEGLMLLLNDILDVSKLDVGKLKFDQQPFDLVQCGREVLENYGSRVSDIDLSIEAPEEAIWIRGDKRRIGQVLEGLLSGSVRSYKEGGAVSLSLNASAHAPGDDRVDICLAVRDNRHRIIEIDHSLLLRTQESREFDAVEASQESDILGMTLCRRLVKAMNGHFEVESSSSLETGIVVRLTLPRASAPALPKEAEGDVPSSFASLGLCMLVVDDNAVNRKVAGLVLAKLGIEAGFASDGHEAIAQAQREPFDLIFMDLRMPKLGGVEACKQIKSVQGPNQATPIVALSANLSGEERQACRNCGMVGALSKPFTAAQLASLIHATLQRHKKEAPAAA